VARSAPTVAPTGWVRIATCRTAPGVTVTVTLALTEPVLAVTIVVPAFTPRTWGPVIEPTAGSELVQITDALATTCPSRAVTVAPNVIVDPDASVWGVEGSIVIAAGVLSGVGGVPVGPESPPPPQLADRQSTTIGMSERGTCTLAERGWGRQCAFRHGAARRRYSMLLPELTCKSTFDPHALARSSQASSTSTK